MNGRVLREPVADWVKTTVSSVAVVFLLRFLLLALFIVTAGCLNITTSLQPEAASVAEVREASDCVPIILGFAFGTATVEGALKERVPPISEPYGYERDRARITKIRRLQLHDIQFLFFGARCLEVVGE